MPSTLGATALSERAREELVASGARRIGDSRAVA